MKRVTYFQQNSKRLDATELVVRESAINDAHLVFEVKGVPVALNTLQVDKLRQQMHEWLNERASVGRDNFWRVG